jgi:hypothetical protein
MNYETSPIVSPPTIRTTTGQPTLHSTTLSLSVANRQDGPLNGLVLKAHNANSLRGTKRKSHGGCGGADRPHRCA